MEPEKQREYIKQQQQLRAMAKSTTNKSLSADSMIENLLSKKETFQKRKENKTTQGIPSWLTPGNGAVHPLYERIWIAVQTGNLADTPILSRLLMTSGLSTDSLGFIWSLANQTVAGILTQQELYFVLALVALAQTGYIVSNVAALNHFPQPPVPKLDLSVLLTTQKDLPMPVYNNASLNLPQINVITTLNPKGITPLCALNLLDSQANTNNIAQNQLIQNTNVIGTSTVGNISPSVLWGVAKPETVVAQSNEKIGISYVSNGGLSLQESGSSVAINNFGNRLVHQSLNNSIGNLSFNSSVSSVNNGTKDVNSFNSQVKTSETDVLTQSFNNLAREKSHLAASNLQSDSFDDEFTDFQSADSVSIHDKNIEISVKNEFENLRKHNSQNDDDDDDDEFTSFQNALPVLGHDFNKPLEKNVLPSVSYEQNFKNDKDNRIYSEPNLQLIKENIQDINNTEKDMKTENTDRNTLNSDRTTSDMYNVTGTSQSSDFPVTPLKSLDKYSVFQEVFESSDFEDKYSVFHNPLPEMLNYPEDRTQNSDSGSNILQNSTLFQSEQSSNNHESLPLELPKIYKFSTVGDLSTLDDDDFSDFQKPFGLPKDETKSSQNYNKYDAFKTSVLELSDGDKNNTLLSLFNSSKTETNVEDEEYTDFQSSEVEFAAPQEPVIVSEDDISFKTSFNELELDDNNDFGTFQNSYILKTEETENQTNSVQNSTPTDKLNSVEQTFPQTDADMKSCTVTIPVEDKYSALRILEPVTDDADDFGDFLGADAQLNLAHVSKPPTESIQVRCLEACLSLLQAGQSMLNLASTPEVLTEVLSDPRAITYLDCLLEVKRVSERILDNIEQKNVEDLRNDLDIAWKKLSPFFSYTDHVPMPETTGAVCGLCQSDTGPSPVKYGLCTFHTPCANLYMHCVDSVLPNITIVQ